MKTNTYKRGFTLIELLVVIAIIGILASVVLASLNTARAKGTNAAIKSNLNGVRTQAPLYYDDAFGTYEVDNVSDSLCVSSNTLASKKGVVESIVATEALDPVGSVICNDDGTSWAVAGQLVGADSGDYYCMDSTGFAGNRTGVVGTDFTTNLSC